MPEEVRPQLQRPLGRLFPHAAAAIEHMRRLGPSRLISIGDIVTSEFLAAGIRPDIAVVDLVVMRSSASENVKSSIRSFDAPTVHVKNPAGKITPELWEALEKARPPLKVIVDGEEDLATIPAVLTSKTGSVVAYGQPNEGVVIVKVNEKKREEFRAILRKFRTA
jgi:uncharacterized protein (UPF0218 family)